VGELDTISVLLIEDDRVDEMAILRTVASEALPYRMHTARTLAEARQLLAGQTFDVILADYQLTDGTSFDLMAQFGDQLVIFVTGDWDDAAAAQALHLGVHDYLIKDVDGRYLKLLNYRIATALRQRRMAQALRSSEERLQAIIDNAPAAIAAFDMAGRLVLENRRHARIAQANGAFAVEAEPPLAGPVEGEETLRHEDGSEHTYLTVRFPMPDAEGNHQTVGLISVDITARKRAEQLIRNLAYFDPLTGLPNRRMLLDRLQQAFAMSARHGSHGAVFFIDLDHFKALNDTLGHDVGDLLLVEVARRLQASVRGEDTVARIGGDEFVVMTVSLAEDPRSAAAQAASVGDKILSAISRPFTLRDNLHSLTPSIGVCLFQGRGVAHEDVVKRADLAMYQAKAAGRGTVRFFDPVMQAAQDARVTLEGELRRALAAGQMGLHLQPQFECRRGLVGAEALVRLIHPLRGVLLPEQFIPIAEQNGLILPLGQWVIEAACAQLHHWAAEPRLRQLQLSVNVSARQFRQRDFVASVARALRDHAAEPARLRLELRECHLQDDPTQTLSHLTALRELGVGIALDEFGVSYSSVSQLKRLPLDQIKIARSLIGSLTSDPHSAAIVKTILGIANGLNLVAIAAGVETASQRDLLIGMGCTHWQGFLFGRPTPALEFERCVESINPVAGAPRGQLPLPIPCPMKRNPEPCVCHR
jgi:diguanylate cyclase (GGDEF)-like protein